MIELNPRLCAIAIGMALSGCGALVVGNCGAADPHAWRWSEAPKDRDRLLEIASADRRGGALPERIQWFAEPTGLRMLCASDDDVGWWWIFDGTDVVASASWIHLEE